MAENEVKVEAEVVKSEFGKNTGPFRRLPENPIEGYRNGVCLDLRVRFAMELLAHSPQMAPLYNAESELDAKMTAKFALDVSTELFAEADARGLIEPIPDDVPESLKAHVRRQAGMQYEANKELARLTEEGSRIRSAVAGAFGKKS